MNQRGLTLLDLLVALIIFSLVVTLAVPSFTAQISQVQTKTRALSLYEALQLTRTEAISRNRRTTLRALGGWSRGWVLFDDQNHNGRPDPGETILTEHRFEGTQVRIEGNRPLQNYVSYIGTGESRFASGRPGGGFQAGRLTVCAQDSSRGYQLVLARMGRVRIQQAQPDDCP